MNENKLYLSVVVPVYDEEEAVSDLHHKIVTACTKIDKPYEIIFVNDGSQDKTIEVLKTLTPIKIINFRTNFGQTVAMDAGIKAAQGLYYIRRRWTE